MKRIFLVFIFIFVFIPSQAQTVIAKQSFEASGDTWTPLNFSTPPCTVGNDVWNYVTSLSSITPNEGTRFWGIRDLNGSCGGNGFETITLPDVNITSFSDVAFSFDYNAIGFDNNDDLKYELFYDGASQGEVIVVNGANGNSDNTNGWLTETVSIPNSVNTVRVILSARCNQGNDRAGFDNIILEEATSNNCVGAESLIVGTSNTQNVITGTNAGATSSGELPNPSCGNYAGNDVWYTTQVPASGMITVETQSVVGSTIDTALEVYLGSCGNLTQLACNDDINFPNNINSQVTLTGIPNTTIFIRVWAYNNASVGDFNIVAYDIPPPPNNDCNGSQTLIVGATNSENVVTGTNEGATDSGVALPDNCDQYQGGDVWYTAQVPASGILIIETSDAGGINDTGIAVYTGNCGSLTQIDCDADSGPGFFSTISLTGLPNTTVYIRVWEFQNNNFGAFNIVAYSPECPFTTTWNGNNWNNGIPNSFTSAIINGDYDIAISGNIESCNCTINPGNTVNVGTGSYILVENNLSNNGIIEIRHEGSLVMVNDDGIVSSNGTINIHKTTTPYNDPLDYTYWSSPTTNETFGSALASSRSDRIFEFNIVSGWIAKSGTDTMTPAKGYLAGAPDTGAFPQTQSVVFDGLINNGIIETPAFQNINSNWNLIGNPYPSAINADAFLEDPLNSSIVNGTIYLWTHNSPISEANSGDERYNYSANDYATYTANMGGTAAVSGGAIPTGFIASAQGFIAQGLTNGQATFNNSMRVTTNNNQFFKTADNSDQKNRIWLNLYNNKGAFSQILVGFIENGTDGIDRYDGSKFGGNYVSFYSIVENQSFATQSKPPLREEESIQLGLYSYIEKGDSLNISIENIEGALGNYNVYLKDKLLNITHDLHFEDYSFIPEPQSVYDDRFELLFTKSEVLDLEEVTSITNELLILNGENQLEIRTSLNSTIAQIKIYDLVGKTIVEENLNDLNYLLNTKNISKGTVLLVSVLLETNVTLIKKIIIH